MNSALWIDTEIKITDHCLYLSHGPAAGSYGIGYSNCTENNGFLCQRKLDVNISDDTWFIFRDSNDKLKELVFVNTPALNWRQSKV